MIYYSGFDLYEVILLLVFILLFIVYKRIFGKNKSIPDDYLSENLPFDPDKQIPVQGSRLQVLRIKKMAISQR